MMISHKIIKCFLTAVLLLIGTAACAPKTEFSITTDRSVSGDITISDGDKQIAKGKLNNGRCCVNIPRDRELSVAILSAYLPIVPKTIRIKGEQEKLDLHLTDITVNIEPPTIIYDPKITLKVEAADNSFQDFEKETSLEEIKDQPLVITVPEHTPLNISVSSPSCTPASTKYASDSAQQNPQSVTLALIRNEGNIKFNVEGELLEKANYRITDKQGKQVAGGSVPNLKDAVFRLPLDAAYEIAVTGPKHITCKKDFKITADNPDQKFSLKVLRNEGKINFTVTGDSIAQAQYKILNHGKQIAVGTAADLNNSTKYLPLNTTYDVIVFGPKLATCKQSVKPTLAKPELSLKLTANFDTAPIARDANKFFKACRNLVDTYDRLNTRGQCNGQFVLIQAMSEVTKYLLDGNILKLFENQALVNNVSAFMSYTLSEDPDQISELSKRMLILILACTGADKKRLSQDSSPNAWSYVGTEGDTVTIRHNRTGYKISGSYNKNEGFYQFDFYSFLRDHTEWGKDYDL